jgi:DNA polymerase I-like protein with 3'-5' exonuclease and polymerase domains/5'-3' exonuclease
MTDTYAILDFNGCIIHSYNSGKDPDAYLEDGKLLNTPGYGIQVLLERYILRVAAYVPLNHIIIVDDDVKPDKEGKFKDFRTLHEPKYKKARREKGPSPEMKYLPELKRLAIELVEAMGIPYVTLANTEADDVIAYLAMNLPGEKHIYTTDGDLVALAQYPGVRIFQKLVETFNFKGIAPKHVNLYKSLCGDSSDGYGGVSGFGQVKWDALNLAQINYLDDVISNKNFEKLEAAYAKSQDKSLKILLTKQEEWILAYDILAKLQPQRVNSKPTETFFDEVSGLTVKIKGTNFNRLNWVKRVPNRADLLAVLARAGTDYMMDVLEQFMPTQTLVTPENLNLEEIKDQIMESRYVSLDWETYQEDNANFKKANQGKTYVDMLGSRISGMGITIGDNLEHTYYFQFDHADTENNLDKAVLLDILDSIPSDMPVVAFNSYFEISVLLAEFKATLPIMHDPMIMHKHIDELSDKHGLKDLSKRYLSYDQLHYEDVIEKEKTMRDYTGAHVFQYGADDPLVTGHLYDFFALTLNLEKSWDFVRECEFPTVQLLAESYVSGVSFDIDKAEHQLQEDKVVYDRCVSQIRTLLDDNPLTYAEALHNAAVLYKADVDPFGTDSDPAVHTLAEALKYSEYKEIPLTGTQKIARWTGTELNLDSPLQMQRLFYGTLGLPIKIRDFKVSKTRKSKGLEGTPQVNSDAIEEAICSGDAVDWKKEVLECFTEAKKCATRIKLYYNKFPLWVHPIDGNVHPRFQSCGTESRRPTGGSPNLLQLGKKGEGVKVRECIVPNRNKGHDLVCSIDWDGEELRVMAGLSGDANLTSCYVGDNLKDAHSIVAAQIMGCDYDVFIANRKSDDKEISKKYDDIRKAAKNVNFASAYGCGVPKLARMVKVDEDTAKMYLDAKKASYARLEEWKEEVKEDLKRDGKVTTLMGSVKHAYDYYTESAKDMQSYYERSSVNYVVQGVCADYLKSVLATLHKSRTFKRHNADLIAPIYDEIVFSCHSSQAVSLIKEIYAAMTVGIPGIPVRMLANPAVGINFGKQIEVLEDCNQILTDELIVKAINKAISPTL